MRKFNPKINQEKVAFCKEENEILHGEKKLSLGKTEHGNEMWYTFRQLRVCMGSSDSKTLNLRWFDSLPREIMKTKKLRCEAHVHRIGKGNCVRQRFTN
jgi:hypothetical protein